MARPAPADLALFRADLVRRDPALAEADAVVPPLVWRTCPRGFAGLAWMIVGQQVSTASAAAVWARFEAALDGAVTPERALALDEAAWRAAGFSAQKTRYVRAMAEMLAAGAVSFDALPDDDDAAVAALTRLKGVGRWTAETYLLMGEGRLDAFPGGDIAVQEALRWADRLPARPDEAALYARAEAWRPLRGVAAHLLWGWYVGVKAKRLPDPARHGAVAENRL